MPSSFDIARYWPPKGPAGALRLAAAVLALLNLAAAWFVIRPAGGSPGELRDELADLRTESRRRQLVLGRTRTLASKVETGRKEGEQFLDGYFVKRRAAYSAILAELIESARLAQIQAKDSTYSAEPIDGSDTLSLMKISANYQGSYSDLIHFLNRLDKSKRLLIVEALQATPQQAGTALNVNLKIDAFVREEGGAP